MTLIDVRGLRMTFGGLVALDNIDVTIEEGETIGLIGPNGSGKTTFFNCLTGIYTPVDGQILWGEGRTNLAGRPAFEINKKGIARTFQTIRLFPQLGALENVVVGTLSKGATPALDAIFGGRRLAEAQERCVSRAYKLLELVGLAGHEHVQANALPYGLQRRLEIARALATNPRLLLLDEPSAGLNNQEIQGIINLVRQIHDMGINILLIEHRMELVMSISDRVVVFDRGKKIADDVPEKIQRDPVVLSAYLGDETGALH